MRPLTTCLAKPGRAPAPASPLAGSPRHPRRSVSRHAVAPPQQAVRTAGKSSRAAPSVEAQPELVGVEQGGAGTANGYSNNVVAVDTALMPSATHTLPVLRLATAASALDSLSSPTAPPAGAEAAPMTTAMACELANAHAPYMQMGSVTVGAGAAAGVFERESDLFSESRSAMATQELTRHAANLGMLAAATVNPEQRKHFYLGFQAEHKLAYSGQGPAPDLSGCREVRMEAKVGVFGRGMASVKIQYFADGRPYGMFKVRYLVMAEEAYRAKFAPAFLSDAQAAAYKELCATLKQPYKNVVRFDETSAPAGDVRIAKFMVGDPARVAGHFPAAPMAPASLLVGHGFEAIRLFADADARLGAGYTVLTYKGGCERTPWLAEQATITATRRSDTDFCIEMAGADGGKLLAFDVAIALHA